MTLVPIDPKNEASVLTLLERAAQWLSEAVHRGDPIEVAAMKAQLATAAEATKQLNLSKEIQLDAQEMVRRAEYALAKAIRRGQEEGAIRTLRESRQLAVQTRDHIANSDLIGKPTAADIDPSIYGNGSQILSMSDGVEPDDFEAAIEEAKAEGNLSRANVVRKVKKQAGPTTRDQRADVIESLAAQGYSSRQMTPKVGVADATVRNIAREFDIDIPADRMVGKTRRIDHTAAVESAVTELDNWAGSLSFIDFAEVDMSERDEWVASLTNSLTELRRFIKQIKETTHV